MFFSKSKPFKAAAVEFTDEEIDAVVLTSEELGEVAEDASGPATATPRRFSKGNMRRYVSAARPLPLPS